MPLGRWVFTWLICLRAPYFGSISPMFRHLEPGRAVVSMRKRRKVANHIGTVHALAMGNLCELAAGLVMEASLPKAMRWIPRGMEIAYLARAETDVTATAASVEQGGGHSRRCSGRRFRWPGSGARDHHDVRLSWPAASLIVPDRTALSRGFEA